MTSLPPLPELRDDHLHDRLLDEVRATRFFTTLVEQVPFEAVVQGADVVVIPSTRKTRRVPYEDFVTVWRAWRRTDSPRVGTFQQLTQNASYICALTAAACTTPLQNR